ncbi:outer membrane protein assembly factor BamA [Novosphingobium sp. G106]|uniref:outer membrane protein assembly factor BamA n=1 Tax=Novosphingobium sp. G106 TaxID=2849500 RepID=UPI0020C26085|nr:outer membrane protein assembly factor BamA [Novosphingobium sp. G106]
MVRSLDYRRASGLAAALLGTTILAGQPVYAQAAAQGSTAPAKPAAAAPAATAAPAVEAPAAMPIKTLTVVGAQRLEPDTILSYIKLRVGQDYTQTAADQALKDLFATELFADAQVRNDGGNVVIQVKENPVVNRIILEGNKRIKDEKILLEIKVAPRQIFTRSKVRADVARIIELYKRQGRFAATVEPKMVMLEQNRVDIVFEVTEGPKSKVRQINIIGNEKFSDGDLRGEMVTKQTSFTRLFSSGTSYDPDRMAFDQQKLRQFYLTKGYADFRVVSAVAELTPDKKDFIITYVVEEGQRYKFGDIKVDSQLRDFDGEQLAKQLPMKAGDWYNAKMVEDTIEKLNETAGAFGYAFADVRPDYNRSKDDLTMGVNFVISEAPRVYVERIDVNGNTLTQDKVVRREFRIAEGDAFNSLQVKRSTNRIKSLGYFQEKFEVEQKPGSAPDRIVLEANVEEKPTGELQLSAGFSSIESFIFQASIQQRNFRGRGQTVGVSGSYSKYSKSVETSFTEPYLFDRNVSASVSIYRRDYNSFNYLNSNRNTTYKQATTGFQLRAGVPLTEYLTAVASYTLNYDNVSLDKTQFYTDRVTPGVQQCDPLLAGRYLCEAIGKRTSSIIGASLIYDTLDNRVHPTRGFLASLGGEFAGLGGSVKYGRIRANASRYFPVGKGFIFSLSAEGGLINSFDHSGDPARGIDDVRLTDRFYLGEPQMRGFDIRGIGPRVLRKYYVDANRDGVIDGKTDGFSTDRNQWVDDALGGKYYYQGRAELEIPLGSGAKELGLRPSIFAGVGAVWGVRTPVTDNNTSAQFIATRDSATGLPQYQVTCAGMTTVVAAGTTPVNGGNCTATGDGVVALGNTIPAYREFFVGNTWKPRVAIGVGVNWNSPFGPFRIDFSKVLLKQDGDNTKTFTFNVGTQF